VIDHLTFSLPKLPDTMLEKLVNEYGLSIKDAGTLLSVNNGDRLDYFFDVMAQLRGSRLPDMDNIHLGKVAGNW
jgi:aspartyl-tRNA(Asn)/glutamyl-tRNA(Gln) amidotransferase subunit B